MNASSVSHHARLSPARFWFHLSILIALMISGSVMFNLYLQRRFHLEEPLPVRARIQHDLEAQERSGRTVSTSALRGKVCAVAYVYTVCPHGCIAVIGEMKKLLRDYGSHPDFHLVSVSVEPERDTAPLMSAFADGIGLKPEDPWWFLTGDQKKLWSFMTDEVGLTEAKPIPEDERLNPLDLYAHDLRIALVDRNANVRGYYDVFHPQPEIAEVMREKLHADTQRLLDEPNPSDPNPKP
jgi:cytochrome oxidase Cu insertion factor (SCO1/SenC/PrrC family)